MHKKTMAVLLAACILGLLGVPSTGQSARVYEPFQATPEFEAGMELVRTGQYSEAFAHYDRLAAQHAGTTLGAESLFKAGFLRSAYGARSDAPAVYREVIRHYPDSEFEITAKLCLIMLEVGDDYSIRLQRDEQLLRGYGAPGLQEIQRNRAQSVNQLRSLRADLQLGLVDVYDDVHNLVALQQGQYSDALPLALFMREAFSANPGLQGSDFMNNLLLDVTHIQYGEWPDRSAPITIVDPTVRIKSPKDGQRKGPRPKIRVQVKGGDWRQPQIDMAKLQFTLDGQDLKPSMRVRTQIATNLKDSKKDSRPFERLRLIVRPAQPLAPGNHVISLTVPVEGYSGTGPGRTSATWSFTVSRPRDEAEDECEDDESDWEDD